MTTLYVRDGDQFREAGTQDVLDRANALIAQRFRSGMREWRLGLNHNPVTLVRKPSAPHRERRLAKTEAHRFPSDDERRRRRVSAPTKDLTSFKFFPEHSAQCGFVHWPRADGLAQRLID